jgi:hypothetical protein
VRRESHQQLEAHSRFYLRRESSCHCERAPDVSFLG